MRTVVVQNEASVAAQVISVLSTGGLVTPPVDDISIEVSVPNFGGHFRLALTDLDDSEIENGRVLVRAEIDANAYMVLSLLGESDADGFHTKSVSFAFETSKKTAESDFRVSTLRAALSLAAETRLVALGLGLDLWFRLDESLRDIGELLKLRQTMYRLMVIERATGVKFEVPSFIMGKDMESLTLLYHAIVERSFPWPFDEVLTIFYAASKDLATRLCNYNQSSDFTHPCFHRESILDFEIPLGEGTITIVGKDIEDFDQVQKELTSNDGHTVGVKVRSRIGLAYYNFPSAPRLPDHPWNAELQMLVNLEEQLDAALLQRYHSLAAATLAGLSDDEKAEMTTRPEIGTALSGSIVRTWRASDGCWAGAPRNSTCLRH